MTDVRRDRLTIKPESREDLSHISESSQPQQQQRVSRFGNGGDAQPEIGIGRFRPPWKQGNTWESCLITGGESGIGRAIGTVLWDKPSL